MRTKIRFRGTVSLMSLGVLAGMNVACEATPRTSETEEAWKSSLDQRVYADKDQDSQGESPLVIKQEIVHNNEESSPPDQLKPMLARMESGVVVERLQIPVKPLEFEKPDSVRGIYINAWAAGSSTRSQHLIDLANRTEVNTFVIDIKDASGYVSHPTRVEVAQEIGADQQIRITDLLSLLDRLHENGIYPIARIVVVKDPLLTASKPEVAIQDTAGGVWIDEKGVSWANLYEGLVWDYHLELAQEMIAIGFPEIQWDYIRFPDSPLEHLERAVFTNSEGKTKSEAVSGFLDYISAGTEDYQVDITADVFGATTSLNYDLGIGQLWEEVVSRVDVILPMVYPSHYWSGSFDIEEPNNHPYEVVKSALSDGLERVEKLASVGSIRPWLQDFTLGDPPYGSAEIRAQIQATYDVGINEWVLWNASSRYTEEALFPAEGFPDGFEPEPMIRINGVVLPLSEHLKERHESDSIIQDDTLERPR